MAFVYNPVLFQSLIKRTKKKKRRKNEIKGECYDLEMKCSPKRLMSLDGGIIWGGSGNFRMWGPT
jgi:hypothetical protein